jgi:heme oxygenase
MNSSDVRPPRTSLLADVRVATREAHERLERQLDLEHHPTLERYRLFVRATCAVVVPLEPSLTAWLGPLFAAPEPGTRMDRLRADLSHLGSDSLPSGAPGMAPAGSMAEAFGAAYVLQGSLLGGAVIARLAHSRLGVGEEGTTYVRLYGDGLARAWRQFAQALEEFGTYRSDAERQVVVAGAERTFEGFGAALEREGLTIG